MDLFIEDVKKENMPEYFEVIKIPMSFNKIRENLDKEKYNSIEEFEKDILLIV